MAKFHGNIKTTMTVDTDKLKKHIFQLKLDGSYDAIVRHAYMVGYAQGHKKGAETMRNQKRALLMHSDLEDAFAEYAKEYDDVLHADEKED
jgi:hypothetical protein